MLHTLDISLDCCGLKIKNAPRVEALLVGRGEIHSVSSQSSEFELISHLA